MDKEQINKIKSEILDYIQNTPVDQLHKELVNAGLEDYQDTKNVVSDNTADFDFVVWKGWVTEINGDGTYEVELIDMIELSTREIATISDDEVWGNPGIQLGSVFMWVIVTGENPMSSIKFQELGTEPDPEVYVEISERAAKLAERMKKQE